MILQILHSLTYDFLTIVYTLLQLYRIICYTKILLDQIVFINPYVWPFTAFKLLSGPYYRFWNRIFPQQAYRKYGINFSAIIALEVLNIAVRAFKHILIYITPVHSL